MKHFGYDENNFVEDNFSFKLQFIIDLKCEQIPPMDWTDTIIYNSFVSENYKQLQQGHFSIFLMVDWKSHPHWRERENWGRDFLKVCEIVIKQTFQQRVSFGIIYVTMRNTYTNY